MEKRGGKPCKFTGVYFSPVPKIRCPHVARKPKGSGCKRPSCCDNKSCLGFLCNYLWAIFVNLEEHYLVVCTILAMLILSLILPDYSEKASINKKLNDVQVVLDTMTIAVDKAEEKCVRVADQVFKLHRTLKDNSTETVNYYWAAMKPMDVSMCQSTKINTTKSEPLKPTKAGLFRRFILPCKIPSYKEIPLMSYIYTHSFDGEKPDKRTTAVSDAQ